MGDDWCAVNAPHPDGDNPPYFRDRLALGMDWRHFVHPARGVVYYIVLGPEPAACIPDDLGTIIPGWHSFPAGRIFTQG